MRKIIGLFIGLLLVSCAAGPRNKEEAFPLRNQDPRIGLVINRGTAHLNLVIYDKTNKLIEQVYVSGVNRYLKINGQNIPKCWVRTMEPGRYRIEVFPFYYKTEIANPLFGRPGRYRIDLPKQTAHVHVGKNLNHYYGGRYWGWVLRLNGGNIPDTAHGLPGIKANFQGKAWELLFGE